MWMLDGKLLPPDTPFVHDDVSYPANWLVLATPEDRAALGIVEAPPAQPRPDDRYYFVQDNGDGTYTSTPKDLDQLKAAMTEEAKVTANILLTPTDWYVVRSSEMGIAVPDEVTLHRKAVRDHCAVVEQAIAAATTVEELAAIEHGWPTSPPSRASLTARKTAFGGKKT